MMSTSDVQLENPQYLVLLLGVAVAGLLLFFADFARRRAIRRFATENLTSTIFASAHGGRRWLAGLLSVAGLLCLALAVLDIRWGEVEREVPQKGIEVMFVLDVSRSMLADDVSPSRLQRAKQQIKDMLDAMSGDRVGLLLFAGETRQLVPLTSHYEDFKQTLDTVGPSSLQRGGSRLGDAINAAAKAFMEKTQDHKAMVIFTDGEDQESKPLEAAQQAFSEHGVRIFTVGLGDVDQGARIPDKDSQSAYVEYQGQTVWSKLNGKILAQIATDTNGAYIPAGIKSVDMEGVYLGYIQDIQQAEFETAKVSTYIPRFQWFALPGLIFLLLEAMVATGKVTSS